MEEFWGLNEDLTRFSKGKPLTYLMYGNIFFFHCRRVVCAVLSRPFGTVSLCNKLQTQKKKSPFI